MFAGYLPQYAFRNTRKESALWGTKREYNASQFVEVSENAFPSSCRVLLEVEVSMASKPSTVRGIFLDWDPTVRNDVTQGDWENGVLDVLQTLMLPPCDTSQAVLDGISATGKKVTIIPVRQPLVLGKKDANAYTNPIDPLTATTPRGKPENVLPQNPPILGVGGGSDSVIEFAAHRYLYRGCCDQRRKSLSHRKRLACSECSESAGCGRKTRAAWRHRRPRTSRYAFRRHYKCRRF